MLALAVLALAVLALAVLALAVLTLAMLALAMLALAVLALAVLALAVLAICERPERGQNRRYRRHIFRQKIELQRTLQRDEKGMTGERTRLRHKSLEGI